MKEPKLGEPGWLDSAVAPQMPKQKLDAGTKALLELADADEQRMIADYWSEHGSRTHTVLGALDDYETDMDLRDMFDIPF